MDADGDHKISKEDFLAYFVRRAEVIGAPLVDFFLQNARKYKKWVEEESREARSKHHHVGTVDKIDFPAAAWIDSIALAAKVGSMEAVTDFVTKGVDVNRKDSGDKNAVQYAAETGHVTILKYLLEHGGAWSNETLEKALNGDVKEALTAAPERKLETLQEEAKPHQVSMLGHIFDAFDADFRGQLTPVQLFRVLLAVNPKLKAGKLRSIWEKMHKGGKTDVTRDEFIDFFMDIAAHETPEEFARQMAHAKEVTKHHRAEWGEEVPAWMTTLHLAAQAGHLAAAKHFITLGSIDWFAHDEWDNTAIYYACKCGHPEMVTLLLDNGAEWDTRCRKDALNDAVVAVLDAHPGNKHKHVL
jgi:ankyrin repeat protein